jgi:flagellar biosynthesis protein FlhF
VPLKTFRGTTVSSLLGQAQAELGPDAVIIRTEKVDGGIELVAADPETAETVGRLLRKDRPVGAARSGRANEQKKPDAPASTGPDILALVGPTGAGKTSAVAKLAAHPRVFEGKRVGLLALDTYRVGALEQLSTHASLLGIPLEPIYEARDLPRAMKRLARCQIILVDCPGRGPRAQRDADAAHRILTEIGPRETHLALPAGLQRELARRHMDHYVARGATHLLATKVDEVPDDWTLFDLAAERSLPMRWLADGQRVPQDLRSAAPRLDAARASLRGRRPRNQEEVA